MDRNKLSVIRRRELAQARTVNSMLARDYNVFVTVTGEILDNLLAAIPKACECTDGEHVDDCPVGDAVQLRKQCTAVSESLTRTAPASEVKS